MSSLDLMFYGIGVRLIAEPGAERLLPLVAHDFAHFIAVSPEGDRFLVTVGRGKPSGWIPFFVGSRSRKYFAPPGEQRIGFFGSTWISYAFRARRARLFFTDADRAYEALYYLLLSYVGERLDRKGWHRVHGLGVTHGGSGTVVMAPSGTGKSSLAWTVFREHGDAVSLLSDDTPLVNSRGELRAFPLRIALVERPKGVPVRKFERARHGGKFVVGSRVFEEKISADVPARRLVILRKSGPELPRPIRRARAVWPLVRWLVLGLETPQIWELFLRLSVRDAWEKALVLVSRARAARAVWRSCAVYEMGRGPSPRFAGKRLIQLCRSSSPLIS